MANYSKETFKKSIESYSKAAEELIDIAGGRYRFSGSGCPGFDNFRPGHMEVYGKHRTDFLHKATHISVNTEYLMDMGSPKHITSNSWIAQDSYIRILARVSRNWDSYEIEPYPKKSLRINQKSMNLVVFDRSWGCANWHDKVSEIKSTIDSLPSDLKKKAFDSIDIATKRYDEWKTELRKVFYNSL